MPYLAPPKFRVRGAGSSAPQHLPASVRNEVESRWIALQIDNKMIGLTVEEVDIFQFVDTAFAVSVQLTDLTTFQPKTGETSGLKVLLAFEGNASAEQRCKEHHPSLLEVISNSGITVDGTAQIWLKVKDVSMHHDNQRFVIYLEAYRPQGETNNILVAVTNPFTCIRHKLVVSEANNVPYTWYKDEGAKDKAIKVLVKLVDASRAVVTTRFVPLSISLIYSSGQPVHPSSVLTVFQEKERPPAIAQRGSEIVRFRVNEVCMCCMSMYIVSILTTSTVYLSPHYPSLLPLPTYSLPHS
ncbi:hypothetical protein EON64_09315 [archaeon]|nr:MAG: hypothetical protein EON64_09315 [archaeon]